jgi:ribulose 1,5-bisphosphate carboxylase large subunit-like protein
LSYEHGERRERLEADLEAVERTLRGALDFISDDRNLTDEGLAAREVLLEEIEAIEQDPEAVRQEHRLG